MQNISVNQYDLYDKNDLFLLEDCTLCPRECRINRLKGERGYCGMDAGLNIASICVHKGEEPSISGANGICNIFFAGCNLRCLYCQNHEISRPKSLLRTDFNTMPRVLDLIEEILSQGVTSVGFVSPSHVVPQVKAIIKGLNGRGLNPITVYNTNSYDKHETIKSLAGIIDVYLPDFKYVSHELALKYSDVPDYPEVALKALKEMYYQKGSALRINEDGLAENGMLLRHLVLPGHVQESIKVLRVIAEELSPGVNLSLMSQYHPACRVIEYPGLNRVISKEEYEAVVAEMEALGFRNGFIQEMDSHETYHPDFRKDHPFE